MVEADETQERRRSPSVRYPGSALPRVGQVMTFLDEVGGTASLGALASRIGLSETNADFVRLVASARSYGLAEWGNLSHSSLRLTVDGTSIAQGSDEERQAALARAFLRPTVFARVARKFEGRSLPAGNGLVEPFKLEGVAASAAPLAAKNFLESAQYAGVTEDHGGRQVLGMDLPYPSEEGGDSGPGAGPRPAARPVSRPTTRPVTSISTRAPVGPAVTSTPARREQTRVDFAPAVNINLQIHIAADASPATVENIFKNIRTYILPNPDADAAEG